MKIDKEYAFELLKELENEFPNEVHPYIDGITIESKKYAHLLYLYDEGLITENLTLTNNYRINSDGLNLLSGQSFLEWLESNHRP